MVLLVSSDVLLCRSCLSPSSQWFVYLFVCYLCALESPASVFGWVNHYCVVAGLFFAVAFSMFVVLLFDLLLLRYDETQTHAGSHQRNKQLVFRSL